MLDFTKASYKIHIIIGFDPTGHFGPTKIKNVHQKAHDMHPTSKPLHDALHIRFYNEIFRKVSVKILPHLSIGGHVTNKLLELFISSCASQAKSWFVGWPPNQSWILRCARCRLLSPCKSYTPCLLFLEEDLNFNGICKYLCLHCPHN